ncbi:phosphatase PAP2 family protein [Nocardia sp. NBC_01329]|uniref:phosphatase PAP2 family protein n=1 Tax=Nocardia sp. NBC_01329 TaxID=2903594 RepID=UPI002E102909|nr:phosphatase PAP2 family protein [Nocardia sp. NBC_01329]
MLGLAVVLFAVFAATTGYVVVGDATVHIDRPMHDWVLTWRTETLTTAATVITHVGGSVVMWALALSACAVLAKRGAKADLLLVAGVGAASAILVPVAKQLIGRPRPPVADHLVEVSSPAFPSGHSVGSAAVVGVLAALFCMRTTHRLVGMIVAALAATFVVLVGLSRIYLGVHWPTDVLAGWTLGGLLVAVGVLIRTRAEDAGPPTDSPGSAVGSGTEATVE